MNSLREIIESSPSVRHLAFTTERENDEPQPLGPPRWDWSSVQRVLVVRLRSIGDTVLTTPSLFALRRFLPHSRIDILLEDWVAPVLDGSDLIDRVVIAPRDRTSARARVARELRAEQYDVVYNLHGGTTATLLPAQRVQSTGLDLSIINTRVCIIMSRLPLGNFGSGQLCIPSNNNWL